MDLGKKQVILAAFDVNSLYSFIRYDLGMEAVHVVLNYSGHYIIQILYGISLIGIM